MNQLMPHVNNGSVIKSNAEKAMIEIQRRSLRFRAQDEDYVAILTTIINMFEPRNRPLVPVDREYVFEHLNLVTESEFCPFNADDIRPYLELLMRVAEWGTIDRSVVPYLVLVALQAFDGKVLDKYVSLMIGAEAVYALYSSDSNVIIHDPKF